PRIRLLPFGRACLRVFVSSCLRGITTFDPHMSPPKGPLVLSAPYLFARVAPLRPLRETPGREPLCPRALSRPFTGRPVPAQAGMLYSGDLVRPGMKWDRNTSYCSRLPPVAARRRRDAWTTSARI